MNKHEFTLKMLGEARQVVQAKNDEPWLAFWMTAIAYLETGGGVSYVDHNVTGYHWQEGYGWEYVESTEAGTGRAQRYRKFKSYRHCFESLYWTMTQAGATATSPESPYFYYRVSREDYKTSLNAARIMLNTVHEQELRSFAREWRIESFSRSYCPTNQDYAISIINLLDQTILDEEGKSWRRV